jgi:NAD(P)-dependent dehydrogenase (short-subunit alcohol dehydrogenase family)
MSAVLKGRSAIITGANQGLGLAIAKAYVEAGANLLICARNAALLDEAHRELQALATPEQVIFAETADVADAQDVERIAEKAINAFGQVQILVNNAGVYGPKGVIEEIDWDEWVSAIQINLFGSVLLCRALLPHFKAQHYGKIVQISGGGATNPLPRLSAYAASKAAIIRFAETLAEEVRQDGIDVNAIAPGALNTRLIDEVLEAGPDKVGQAFYDRTVKQKEQGGTPLEVGASLAVYLGSAESDGITGKLISAVWDPWETLAEHRDDLKGDIYTLRRIVPKDRGQTWGDR